jgi:hypothetical protein
VRRDHHRTGRPKDIGPSFQSSDSDVECHGGLTGTFQNVIVTSGSFCFLFNSTLTGNLKILPGGQVTTTNNTIAGDIQADKALFVDLIRDRVGGNIEIFEGPGRDPFMFGFLDYRVREATVLEGNIHVMKNQGNVFVEQNTLVKGNIQVEDNFNLFQLIVEHNQVPRNIQAYKNMGSGPKVVRFNIAGQSVQCFENQPVFAGFPNTAPNLEGQCGVTPSP